MRRTRQAASGDRPRRRARRCRADSPPRRVHRRPRSRTPNAQRTSRRVDRRPLAGRALLDERCLREQDAPREVDQFARVPALPGAWRRQRFGLERGELGEPVRVGERLPRRGARAPSPEPRASSAIRRSAAASDCTMPLPARSGHTHANTSVITTTPKTMPTNRSRNSVTSALGPNPCNDGEIERKGKLHARDTRCARSPSRSRPPAP